MVDIKTYQDFLEVRDKEREKMLFVFDAIKEYQQSDEYREAVKNEKALLARISALENELKIKKMKNDIDEQLTLDGTKSK